MKYIKNVRLGKTINPVFQYSSTPVLHYSIFDASKRKNSVIRMNIIKGKKYVYQTCLEKYLAQ